VWQLRPADPAPAPARSEGDGAFVSAQIIERERKVVAPAPPPPDASTRARAFKTPAASAPILGQRKAAPVAPAAAAPVPEEASAEAVARVATVGPDEQPIVFHETVADARSADPFTAPAAAPAAPAAMQAYSEAEKSEAFEVARARQQRSDEQAVSAKRLMAQPAPVAASAVSAAPTSAEPQPTLDRIEVTGSRITPAELLAATPVAQDARLEPVVWLERIRERRDAGDADGARESLVLFRKTHPRVRLPDDLRALARSPTTR